MQNTLSKVVIPNDVANAIEKVWDRYQEYIERSEELISMVSKHMLLTNWNYINEYHFLQFATLVDYAEEEPVKYMRALVEGYEVELAPEDQVREYYSSLYGQGDYGGIAREAIEQVAKMLNIELK